MSLEKTVTVLNRIIGRSERRRNSVMLTSQNNLLIEGLSDNKEGPAKVTSSGPDVSFLKDLLRNSASSEEMLYTEMNFYPELGEGWRPLDTMTKEEYQGSRYDPEC